MEQLEFPTIFLLSALLQADELSRIESQLSNSLTRDASVADLILGNISKKERALFELRRLKIHPLEADANTASSSGKKRNLSGSRSSDSHSEESSSAHNVQHHNPDRDSTRVPRHVDKHFPIRQSRSPSVEVIASRVPNTTRRTVRVIKLSWFHDSVASGRILPPENYLIYQGYVEVPAMTLRPRPKAEPIIQRAQSDRAGPATNADITHTARSRKRPTLTIDEISTSDSDTSVRSASDFTVAKYSCQRTTLKDGPNAAFVAQLRRMENVRLLNGDQIGVRAYSASISTILAYPYQIKRAEEVSHLPSCGNKVAELFKEWKCSGRIHELEGAEMEPKFSILQQFYNIWGVGVTTASEFYKRGWRDLDDVIQFGWDNLQRDQQLGVKFHSDFQMRISRAEAEMIGNIVLRYANKKRPGYRMTICGSYRRGNADCGDVDVLLSHPDPHQTLNFIDELLVSLERDKLVTHTLKISKGNSDYERFSQVKRDGGRSCRLGFDGLDRILAVWQNPSWDSDEGQAKNANPHRRVDIVISPWRTVGCAIIGWTGGTMFERDLRRYCADVKGLKFDTTGVRRREEDQSWIDLESGPEGEIAPDMLVAEKRVFTGLGLEWRLPEERCTN